MAELPSRDQSTLDVSVLLRHTRATMDRRLASAFADNDQVAGLHKTSLLAKELELTYPDAAASLREGLDEMFTIARIGATPTLQRSLTTTNPIASMISIAALRLGT